MTALLGWLAAGLVLAMLVPQTVRMVRLGSAGGVSQGTWALNSVLCLAWLVYSARHHIAQGLVLNVVALAGVFVLLCVLWSEAGAPRWRPFAAAAGLAGLGVLFAWLPNPALVVACVAAGAVSDLPQVRASWRSWRNRRAGAASTATWLLAAAASATWALFGFLTGDAALTWGNVWSLANRSAVCVLETAARRRGPADPNLAPAIPADAPA